MMSELLGEMKMPLSEKERRQLEALERALAADDPVLVRILEQGSPRRSPARSVLIVLLMGAAFTVIITGIISALLLIGVLGFILMIAAGTRIGSTHQRTQITARVSAPRRVSPDGP